MGSGAQGETSPLLGSDDSGGAVSGREQAAPGQEGEERPGPLWEGGLHRGFQSALRAISKEAKGDEKWAAVSAELATAGIEKTSEQCKVYFKQAKKHIKSKQDGGSEDRRSRSARKWTKVKREIRSELPDQWAWQKCSYQTALQPPPTLDNMERVHCKDLSVQEFIRRWEAPCLPVVIDGLADAVMPKWQPTQLLHRFANVKLKCGDDDDGRAVRIKLRHYRRYVQTEAKVDDSPLYVFDSAFGERAPAMLQDYEVPPYFQEDLFQHVGSRRPPFRWIILGPRFSGSGIHIDPLGTSAWNMLMCGHKRWVLFTPDVSADVVKPPRGMGREAVVWFDKMLPQLKRQGVPCIDFVQKPGETIFVPSGWWHVILNLDVTVAVTQNYASTANFEEVWAATAKSRPRLASFWLSALEQRGGHSALVAHACELLRLWDPVGFERLPPPPQGSPGPGCDVQQQWQRRRNGLRDLMLDVRWKRRDRRDERRRQQKRDAWMASSCWCWPWRVAAAASGGGGGGDVRSVGRDRVEEGDYWVCDDDHSTTSSDSSTSDEEEVRQTAVAAAAAGGAVQPAVQPQPQPQPPPQQQQEAEHRSQLSKLVAGGGDVPYEPIPDAKVPDAKVTTTLTTAMMEGGGAEHAVI